MRRRIRKAVSAVVAAALACSMVPAAAFAATESSGSVPASRSASARATQLSVTVPAALDFSRGGSLVIQEKDTWGTMSAPMRIQNGSSDDLYVSAVQVNQGTSTGTLSNLYTGGSVSMALKSQSGSAGATGQVGVGSSSTSLSMAEDAKDTLLIPANGSADLTFTMDKDTATYQTDDALKAAAEKGTLSLASLSWTFSTTTSLSPEDELLERDGFYLKIADTQVGQASGEPAIPTSMLGKLFSLEEVKQHSKALANGTATEEVKDLYNALVTSMAPEGDYTCYVRYNNEAWPVRIIGVCQDVVAEDFGGYTAGNKVGLTFQFRDLIAESPMRADSSTSADGWGGENAQDMRYQLSSETNDSDGTNDTYLEKMDIKDSIVPVRKYYEPSWNDSTVNPNLPFTEDKMFLASFYELTGQNHPDEETTWIPLEGTGKDHNEQYQFYQNKGIYNGKINYKWLVKYAERDWSWSKVENASYNHTVSGMDWWERSVDPWSTTGFLKVYYTGRPDTYADPRFSWGVCPCFCL